MYDNTSFYVAPATLATNNISSRACQLVTVQSPEKLGVHLKNSATEADRRIQDLNGGLISPEQGLPPNLNNNRASFSIMTHYPTSSITGCHGGSGDADKELLLWERRAKGLKKMLLGFDQTSESGFSPGACI